MRKREREGELRERERERKRKYFFLTGMTGALAPFYLVENIRHVSKCTIYKHTRLLQYTFNLG
jgi:hypothetical protein